MKKVLNYHSFLSQLEVFNHCGIDLWRIICPKISGYNGGLLPMLNQLEDALKISSDGKTNIRDVLYKEYITPQNIKRWRERRWNSNDYYPLELMVDEGGDIDDQLWYDFPENAYIFLASYENYLAPMFPIIKQMCIEGKAVVLISHQGIHGIDCPDELKTFRTFRFYKLEDLFVNSDVVNKVPIYQKKYKKNRDLIFSTIEKELGTTGELLVEYFSCIYDHVFGNYIPAVSIYIDIALLLVKKKSPRALFVAMLRRSVENSFSEVFKANNIAINHLKHGIFGEIDEENYYCSYGYINADKVFVWSDIFKKILLRNSFEHIDESQIYVSGNPNFERIVQMRQKDTFLNKESVMNILGLKSEASYFLLTEGGCAPEEVKQIAEIITKYSNFILVVKLHKHQVVTQYDQFMCLNNGENILVFESDKKLDLHSLIYHSEMLLAKHSTTMLEALACRVPVGVLKFIKSHASFTLPIWTEYGMPTFDDIESFSEYFDNIDLNLTKLSLLEEPYNKFEQDMATDCVNRILSEV